MAGEHKLLTKSWKIFTPGLRKLDFYFCLFQLLWVWVSSAHLVIEQIQVSFLMLLGPSKLNLFFQQNQNFQTQLVTPYPETQDSLTGLYPNMCCCTQRSLETEYIFFSALSILI